MRHTLITVNARCKQTAQLTAKQFRSGIHIRILLTCLKRVTLSHRIGGSPKLSRESTNVDR